MEFGDNLVISNSDTEYFLDVVGSSSTFIVSGSVSVGTRCTMTQGTGAWSFGSYSQTGISTAFDQGATITIGGDFTVSDGVFNAIGNMTVPGSWDTATGRYINDDNVVTLTGDTKTLAMNSLDSFSNVTVSGSYTMDTDTTVRLRATISGTVDGTGDFLEPLPEFTSTPWLKGCPLAVYEYEITQTYWDTLTINEAPYWLDIYDGVLKGIPGDNETGIYSISLMLVWNDMTVYQNYTLIVCSPTISELNITILGVVMSLALGFGLLLVGLIRSMPPLIIYSGFIWLFSAVTIYKEISVGWTIIGIGLGMMILASGGLQLVDESES